MSEQEQAASDAAVVLQFLETSLMDSKPITLWFKETTTDGEKIDFLLRLNQAYQRMGGGTLLIESINDDATSVRIKTHDDPAHNLIY